MTVPRSEVMYGTLDLLVLKTLEALGPQHGYTIAQRIHQVSKEALAVNQGTLYPALLRLEHNGWIASEWGVTENSRKARYYRITNTGRKRLAEEEGSWAQMVEIIERVLQGAF